MNLQQTVDNSFKGVDTSDEEAVFDVWDTLRAQGIHIIDNQEDGVEIEELLEKLIPKKGKTHTVEMYTGRKTTYWRIVRNI